MRPFVFALIMLAAAGCKCREPAPPSVAPVNPDDDVKPAFSGTPKSIPAPARALCDALHRVPAQQRAQCCKGGEGVHFADECARVLGLALEARTVALGDVESCVTDLAQSYAGCAWVGPNEVELPQRCLALVTGTVQLGQVCRSSLECVAGTRCRGAGPTAVGKCAALGEDGVACELAVDTLASYTRQPAPRECLGFCQRHRCESVVTDGGACTLDAQCPGTQRCAGSCVDGLKGKAGETCVPGGCEAGLRCVGGKCAAPKGDGAACENSLECLGGCVDGHCATKC